MPDAVFAAPSERLPWLTDNVPAPAPKRGRPIAPLLVSAFAAVATVAGGWAMLDSTAVPQAPPTMPLKTVSLPPPAVETPARAEPQGPTVSEIEALRPVAVAPKKAKRRPESRSRTSSRAAPSADIGTASYDARAWRSGVPGRIIQLGAFRTSAQAHGEWERVYYRYPLLRPLSPRVIRSKVRGRSFYRLQLGTFSQAHSELLCQRLRTLGEGCIVLGLRGRAR